MNKLEAIEKAFIRFAAVHSSAAKQLARWEIESWLDEALIRVGRNVAASQNYRTLQKRFTTQLGHYDASLRFDVEQSYSAVGGWRSGVTVAGDGQATGAIDSFVFATDAIPLQVGDEAYKNQYLEWTSSGASQPLSVALWPVSIGIDALKPSVLIDQPDILFGVGIETGGKLTAYARGEEVLNPDLTVNIETGERLRIYFAASGAVMVQVFEATTSVKKAEYPILQADDRVTPLRILETFIPVVLFHEDNCTITQARVGVEEPYLAAIDERVIVDSIRTRGSVSFEDGKTLSYVSDGSLRGLPRVKGQWHWTDENRQIRIFPSPAVQKTYTEPETSIWHYDSLRRAWVSLAALPAGVSLTSATILAEYDPDTVLLVAGRDYAINTAKEAQTVKLPANAADGAIVRLADSGTTWASNPLTLLASSGAVLLEMFTPLKRRLIIECNAIPRIEEVPFEVTETVINALVEIALERKGQPAMKQKMNQVSAPITDAKPDQVAA